ncbi:MAG TPA: FtsX-like permease family protein, partial [Blastocatellia bacterium]|nr:FtsX-like permease family protein [Blastocatellia bacterium]
VVTPMTSYVLGSARPALFFLMAASILLLLIACTNVAGLLLARSASRKKEMAVRAALGAGRARLVRQLFTESLLLALLGGTFGTAFAICLIAIFKKIAPADVPRIASVHLSAPGLVFASSMALVSAILFGLAPALSASKVDLAESLKDTSAQASGGAGSHRLRAGLVIAEVGLTLVLTIGAALVVLSFRSLERVDLGFDPRNLFTAQISLRGADYGTPQKRREWYRQLMDRLEAHPEVEAAGMDLVRPLEGTIGWDVPYQAEGQPVDAVPGNPVPNFEIITPHYFRATRIQLVAGREFNEQDTEDSPPVVIISRSAAGRMFGGENAVGKRIKLGQFLADSPWLIVVGVVADARYRALDDSRFNVYVPYTQRAFPVRYVMIRVNPAVATPGSAARLLRKEVSALDGRQAVSSVTTMDKMVDRALARPRFSMMLLLLFASIAAFLATIGIYGIVSYSVSERTREIGIRLALGAGSTQILRMITANVFILTAAGIVLGLVAAFSAMRIMTGLLYGIRATDPLVFAAASLLLALIAMAAAYVPARRAARIEPASSLRSE